MAISYINTIEVDSIAKEINTLANEFNNEINNLFNRFAEVPTTTQEWVGDQASFYFNTIAQDKKQYVDFANKLRNVSNKLYSDIAEVNSCLKKNIDNES